MIALGWLAQGIAGTTTWCSGLACTPTTPASLAVNVGPGILTTLTTVDGTAFGTTLPIDTTDPLMKSGINITATLMATLTPPATSGQSQYWVLQGQMQEADGTPVVLNYYNPTPPVGTTPVQPFSGPNNGGASQNTQRTQRVALQWVAGAPATTGTQTVPAVTAGWTPLYVVALANGATTITSGNIALHPAAPFVDPANTGLGLRPGRFLGVQGFGAPGTYPYTPSPGARSIIVEMVGGGGAGAGAAATGSSQYATGGGGGSGAYLYKRIISLAAATVVVGAAGVAVSGGPGGNGGTSSFGGLYTAAGGNGGLTAGPSSGGFTANPGGGGSVGGTGDIEAGGNPGVSGQQIGSNVIGGNGGASTMFSGAGFGSAGLMGGAAIGPGCGGGGASRGPSQSAVSGGAGGGGYIKIWEFS